MEPSISEYADFGISVGVADLTVIAASATFAEIAPDLPLPGCAWGMNHSSPIGNSRRFIRSSLCQKDSTVRSAPPPQRFTSRHSRGPEDGPWELAIAGELNDKSGDLIDKLVDVPRGSSGLIYFDSGGGSAYAGLAMATIIRLRELDATGIVAGECSSAALLPFAACPRRIVTPHSSLFFHPMRWQSEEDVKLEEAAEWARHFKILEDDLDGLLARLLSVPVERVIEWSRPGRFLTGSEFVQAGLAKLLDIFSPDLRRELDAG